MDAVVRHQFSDRLTTNSLSENFPAELGNAVKGRIVRLHYLG